MSVLKMAFALTPRCSAIGFKTLEAVKNQVLIRPTLPSASIFATQLQSRGVSTHEITKNIQLISADDTKANFDPKTLKLTNASDKPLCILITWLLARQKHIKKYSQVYLEQGFDVLTVTCTPWQLLWPLKGTQLVAADLLRFLHANESIAPLAIHGFSIGGYIWGELCMHYSSNKPKYQPVLDRVAMQVWDSAADMSEIPMGVPLAVFPKNKVMQNALRVYIKYHMKQFYEPATVHYMRSSQQFHRNPCAAPSLFLVSATDPVGTLAANKRVADTWVSLGRKVTFKCWDRSPHVLHFAKHTKEYLTLLYHHMESAGLLQQREKMRARL